MTEKTVVNQSILDEILDKITPQQQRATDIRMIIAAKLGDKIDGQMLFYGMSIFDISRQKLLVWLSGTHDFTISEIAKIEQFLGEKLINIS